MIDEYLELDATGMAELVRTGQISAGELAECAIERIEALNPRLNAVIHTFYERGRGLAAKAPAGPFGGVPFLLKDILGDLAGEPTRQGSRIMPPVPAEVNAELTDRFLAAGLVPLGKTNVPEFGLVGTTEPALYGPAKNPGTRRIRPVALRADRPARWRRGWFPWPMPTMAADRSAFRLRPAVWLASSRRGHATRWGRCWVM